MNIKHFLSAAAALTMLAACSEYDPGESGNVVDLTDAEIKTIQEYTENFVERYGEMDPNHTWGFGELAGTEEIGTRAVNVNRNEWDRAVKENNQIVGYETFTNREGQHMIVPGFPSKVVGDGLYYIEESVLVGDNQYVNKVNGYTEAELIQKGKDSYLPAGDVTDEEIQYVSEWFRTNQNPDSETPPFTEFFIQDISQDYDRVSYPNGDPINRNLQVYVGGTLNAEGWYEGGTPDNGTDPITFGMDYFAVETSTGAWEHENNFNAQKTNKLNGTNPDNSTTFANRTLKYWTTNGGYTTSFSYHNSDNSTHYENYVLVHLTFTGPRTGRQYDGYYLAFDYQYKKEHASSTDGNGNTTYKYSQRKPDGYYSNWIVKLAPADPDWHEDPHSRTVSYTRRVMCEDLGETDDFDFNDVVFDVTYTLTQNKDASGNWVNDANGWVGQITLRASGGTLPIYIENFDGQQYECHQKMGGNMMSATLYNPINVGTGLDKVAVALDPVSNLTSTNPDNINIYVYTQSGERANNLLKLPSHKGDQQFGNDLAPQKLCVPVDTRWMKERQQIEWVYDHFRDWVGNENGEYGFGKEKDWTKYELKDTNKLY